MKTFSLNVSGDFACFTRPEMKVERVSYDVMTPSAARGIFEAILWKPAICWQVTRIEILKPVRWVSVRRNEVGAVVSTRNLESAMKKGRGTLGIFIEKERQQRAGLFLRDVEYIVSAHFKITNKAGAGDNETKFIEMFQRRARNGQCFHRPYLGCREFAARFQLIQGENGGHQAIGETRDLGWMLYDLDYSGSKPMPRFFHARLEQGILNVPPWDSEEVRG